MIRYFVDKENGVVVATITESHVDTYYWLRKTASKYLSKSEVDRITSFFMSIGSDDEDIKAIARCSVDDVFDENIGKRIAKMKLLQKIDKYHYKLIEKMFTISRNTSVACSQIERDILEKIAIDYKSYLDIINNC